jgi:AraC-like DNA-binding protein
VKTILHEIGKDAHFKLWHALPLDENMIIYFHEGDGSIVCGESVYPIKAGALCFIGAGKYHYTMPSDPAAYDRSKIFFSSAILQGIVSLASGEKGFSGFAYDSLVYAEIPEAERESVVSAFFEAESEKNSAIEISVVSKLLYYVEKYSVNTEGAACGDLGGAIDYIKKNLFKEITIDEICREVHISKYYFCRRFKETMGMTVMDYVLKTRIIHAKQMLEKENASVTDVSDRCGFSSVSYFCRVFKESVGVSPLKYRKQFD